MAFRDGLLPAQHIGCNGFTSQSDCLEVVEARWGTQQQQVLRFFMTAFSYGRIWTQYQLSNATGSKQGGAQIS
jgi:hypothetical protein